jgi:hypothetical protein
MNLAGRTLFQLTSPRIFSWQFTLTRNGRECGHVMRQSSGFQEYETHADKLSVGFPADLPAGEKLLIMAASFSIRFLHFGWSYGKLGGAYYGGGDIGDGGGGGDGGAG